MLLEYGFKNFLAFKEGASISFRLDANCPKSISDGLSFSHVMCIKGANASGKTNTLRALDFLSSFCTRSFSNDADGKILVIPHFESEGPVDLYAEFEVNGVGYRYELSVTQEQVVREAAYRTKAKKVRLFERKQGGVAFTLREFGALKSIKVRKNASIVSTAHQHELEELRPIYDFFNGFISNVGFGGLKEDVPDDSLVSKFLFDNEPYLNFVKKFISECDVGVTDITILSTPTEKGERFFPCFWHGDGVSRMILKYFESSGTKALYRSLANYQWVLENGGVLIADEFDVHLHPHILTKLLGLFTDRASNPKDAQIIFTTHSEEVLNYLGRYRTYLVNKDDNESYTYRLDEIPGTILRNDRPILPAYNEGKIGGVPRI